VMTVGLLLITICRYGAFLTGSLHSCRVANAELPTGLPLSFQTSPNRTFHGISELSMGRVDPWFGLGWVEIFQFLVVGVGSTIAKVRKFEMICI